MVIVFLVAIIVLVSAINHAKENNGEKISTGSVWTALGWATSRVGVTTLLRHSYTSAYSACEPCHALRHNHDERSC